MKIAQQIRESLNNILHILVCVYMILLIAVLPFYYTNGYGHIGSDKYEFFYGVTTKMGIVFLAIWVIMLVFWVVELAAKYKTTGGRKMPANGGKKSLADSDRKDFLQGLKKHLSLTDCFALAYGIALVCSYLHSDYRTMTSVGSAWDGAIGWHMGFTTQIMFLAVYFVVSRYYRGIKWLPVLFLPVTFVVFFLGYCNRFGVRPLHMEYANESFISTIGNINWYCGYTVVVLFGVLYCWWSESVKNKWIRAGLWLVSGLGMGTLVTQGSNSGHLALIIMCFVFFLLSVKEREKMQRFGRLLALLGGVLAVTMILRKAFPGHFLLQDRIVNLLTDSVLPILLLAAGFVLYGLPIYWDKKKNYPGRFFVWTGRILLGLGMGLFAVTILLIVWNTLRPGSIGRLSEIPIFTFDLQWGSNRGATYIAGVRCFMDQDFGGKLFGVGPDSMAMYIYEGGNQELYDMMTKKFDGRVLTNAHCEWLTVLVDVGILGLAGFGGMIISSIVRYIKSGKTNVLAAACGMGILAYTINNVVSFQQAMATSTMFLILGMGEAFIRAEAEKTGKVSESSSRKRRR